MGRLVMSQGQMFSNIFLLGLLHCAVLSQCSTLPTNAATTNQATRRMVREMAKLEGATARFRRLITDEEFSLRNLLEVDEKTDDKHQDEGQEQTPEQETVNEHNKDQKETKEDEEKVTEGETEVENSNENLKPVHQEKTDQQQQHDKVEGGEEKTEENKSDPEFNSQEQQQSEQQKKSEEGKTEEKLQSETEGQQQQQQQEEAQHPTEEKGNTEEDKKEEAFVFPEPYLLGPTIKDWDEQRATWLDANPHMKSQPDGKPRVLIVTGSSPWPCVSPLGDHFQVKALKLKIDYARMHNYEIYYNIVWLDPLFGSFWVKLPTIRTLMLTHPEIEWFFWVDSDAMFTDMLFEAPWATYEGYNMIMWGMRDYFYKEKAWTGFNAGVFMIRNCQWTLDLFDKWSPMGPEGPVRNAYGKVLTAFLPGRRDWPSDDQGALAYLMLTDEAVKAKVKLVDSPEYMISGWWVPIVDTYEELMEKHHPGLGNHKWPWITHFTGCGPCIQIDSTPQYQKCMKNIDRAFHFADNQVLAYMGFQHQSLDSREVIRLRNETDRPLELLGLNPWAERMAEVAAASDTS